MVVCGGGGFVVVVVVVVVAVVVAVVVVVMVMVVVVVVVGTVGASCVLWGASGRRLCGWEPVNHSCWRTCTSQHEGVYEGRRSY